MMSGSPALPMQEPHHFSDYGFDPQIDLFQEKILEEAVRTRKHRGVKRESSRSTPLEALHFVLQKPISKDSGSRKKRTKWWKSALNFWKWRKSSSGDEEEETSCCTKKARTEVATTLCCSPQLMSGPLYFTESSGASWTPFKRKSTATTGKSISGRTIAGLLKVAELPYFSLRDLKVTDEDYHRPISASSPIPIYWVT